MNSQIKSLINREVEGVYPIHDYYRIIISGNTILNIYSQFSLEFGNLSSIIGKKIISISQDHDVLIFQFEKKILKIDISGNDSSGPEFCSIRFEDSQSIVWN